MTDHDDENWHAARECLRMKIDDADLPELRSAVSELLSMVINLETTVYRDKIHQGSTEAPYGLYCTTKRAACPPGPSVPGKGEAQVRQGSTEGVVDASRGARDGAIFQPSRRFDASFSVEVVTTLERRLTKLFSFALRFAVLLRQHGAFGMNRDEGALLKEFDEWVEAETCRPPLT